MALNLKHAGQVMELLKVTKSYSFAQAIRQMRMYILIWIEGVSIIIIADAVCHGVGIMTNTDAMCHASKSISPFLFTSKLAATIN